MVGHCVNFLMPSLIPSSANTLRLPNWNPAASDAGHDGVSWQVHRRQRRAGWGDELQRLQKLPVHTQSKNQGLCLERALFPPAASTASCPVLTVSIQDLAGHTAETTLWCIRGTLQYNSSSSSSSMTQRFVHMQLVCVGLKQCIDGHVSLLHGCPCT
jgi:hypothetical protein